MTESYLNDITPDSLSGLIFGFEGVRHSLTILNGPTGCKFYHSITVENQSLRKDDMDPLHYPEEWFFGQGRVPCTYLDKRDYVYGSDDKLSDAIKFILGRITPEILVIVNTPGAALIGDDLERIATQAVKECGFDSLPVITCQSPGYSKDVIDGYIRAAEMVIDKLCEPSGDSEGCDSDSVDHAAASADSTSGPSVNLIGFSLYQKYHAGDIAELTRLLGLCGIKVNTAFLCESTVDEIRKLSKADLNVVVDPDWGLKIAEELEDRFGTPFIESEYGYPVGFKAAEKLISDICSRLSADPEPALDDLRRARAKAYIELARINSLTGLPKGASFKVTGTPAVKRGYSTFLTEYLGMTETDDDPEIVLADGNTIARMKAEGRRFSGIEISLPTIGYIDVIDKTHIGSIGGLFLIEQILNSFVY